MREILLACALAVVGFVAAGMAWNQGYSGGPAVVAGVVFVILHFWPTIVARHRNHPSSGGILALNLFLGWTLIGWVVALAWSLNGAKPSGSSLQGPASNIHAPGAQARTPTPGVADELLKLVALRDSGVLTEQEFELQKRKALGEP